MKKLLFAFLILCSGTLYAQERAASGTQKTIDIDSALTKVEIESEFPGGQDAWFRYLQQNLTYPQKAIRKNVQGTVMLQFIVDKDGSISQLEAISGPELLKDAAVKALQNSPKWIPANQFGKKVKSYKKQPITFRLQ